MSQPERLSKWKEFFPIIGPITGSLIVASTTVLVAYGVTRELTTATKRTEFFLHFTERYHKILEEKQKLDRPIIEAGQKCRDYQPTDLQKADAHQLYFQLFGLMYDEFYAYRHDFLDPEVFAEWMIWQMYDSRKDQFEIGGVCYADGWKAWAEIPTVKLQDATKFMEQIHGCADPQPDPECVKRFVISARWQPPLAARRP